MDIEYNYNSICLVTGFHYFLQLHLECGPNEFKDFIGNSLCIKCGNNSSSRRMVPRFSCECDHGYFRPFNQTKSYTVPCYPASK